MPPATDQTPKPSLRVKREDVAPPTGWHCFVSETGQRFEALIFSALVDAVAHHLSTRGLDPAEAAQRIHTTTAKVLVAKGHAALVDLPEPPARPVEVVNRTVAQYASGAKAKMLKWWAESPIKGLLHGRFERGESVFVDQAEADRRALVCATCPKNVIPTGKGWLRAWTDDKMLECVMDQRTAYHNQLGVCGACSCELRAAVWWPADILRAVTPKKDIPKFPPAADCWKREILQP